jgi:4-hydroxybenzoate polyprenyltransferase
LQIARPDHWFKNLFMLPGLAVALLLKPERLAGAWLPFLLGVVAACLTASANYAINEYLDREYDKRHPIKKNRPSAGGLIRRRWVVLEWTLLAAASLALAWAIGFFFFVVTVWFLLMGVIYNVKPLRTKDVPYLDVLSESINNPIRFLLGWATAMPAFAPPPGAPLSFHYFDQILATQLPPSSVMMSYWFGGAFLMAVKRYAEFRQIGDPAVAASYRRSFQHYTPEKLLVSSFFYALNASFFLAIFLIKYRIEFLLTFPLFSLLFAWYLHIGFKENSAAQHPEKLYRERSFMFFVLLLVLVVFALFVVDVPKLGWLLRKNFY